MKRIALALMTILMIGISAWASTVTYFYPPGGTVYVRVRTPSTGTVWQTTTSTFVAWADANVANYDVALTAAGGGYYYVTFPVGIAEGVYDVGLYLQAGGAPATGDLYLGGQSFPSTGVTPADLTYAHGTAITEAGGAGRLAASISTWGNVATPAATAASVNQTGDAYAAATAVTTNSRLLAGTVATAGNTRTFTLSAGFPAAANRYPAGTVLTFTDATTGLIYASRLKSYSASRVVTVDPAFAVAPELGDTVVLLAYFWPFGVF